MEIELSINEKLTVITPDGTIEICVTDGITGIDISDTEYHYSAVKVLCNYELMHFVNRLSIGDTYFFTDDHGAYKDRTFVGAGLHPSNGATYEFKDANNMHRIYTLSKLTDMYEAQRFSFTSAHNGESESE